MTGLLFIGHGFRVLLSSAACAAIREAGAASFPRETAGPLFGQYIGPTPNGALDTALVLEAPVAVRASALTTCESDGEVMVAMGAERWPDSYFLGEWHTHPDAAPDPSSVDIERVTSLAASPTAKCPEPVMVIMGGMAAAPRWSVHVVSEGRPLALTEEQATR